MENRTCKQTSNVLINKMFFKKISFTFILIIFATSVYSDDKMALGSEVFNNKGQCGLCHTLEAAESEGKIGPNLDLLKPQKEQIAYVVSNGIGVMPAFEDTLTSEEIEAVANYVYNSTNK